MSERACVGEGGREGEREREERERERERRKQENYFLQRKFPSQRHRFKREKWVGNWLVTVFPVKLILKDCGTLCYKHDAQNMFKSGF